VHQQRTRRHGQRADRPERHDDDHRGGPTDHVRVSRQVLCRRVKNEIGAELEGPLENRRREGVVDQTESAVAVGDFRRCSDRTPARAPRPRR
jgi:hypothetical protein